MGFDFIDKKHGKPKKIELECVDCGSTNDVTKASPGPHQDFSGTVGSIDDPNCPIPLCKTCRDKRNPTDQYDYFCYCI